MTSTRASGGKTCNRRAQCALTFRSGSLWHASGMPARELAERMGHSKASMSLDVYTHVMPPDEVQPEVIVVML